MAYGKHTVWIKVFGRLPGAGRLERPHFTELLRTSEAQIEYKCLISGKGELP